MEHTKVHFEEMQMRGKPYTFVVSLYCTLMIWSAFLSIDRHAFSSAAVAGAAAEKVQAVITQSFHGAVPAAIAETPAVVNPVSVRADVKPVSSFKEAADLLEAKGEAKALSTTFCARYGIDAGGKPWPIKLKSAPGAGEQRIIVIGNASPAPGQPAQDIVFILRQDNNKATGEAYLSGRDGSAIRAYTMPNNATPTPIPANQAAAGFANQKNFWMSWLPDNTAVVAAASAEAPSGK